jgi:zinc transporter
VREQHTESVDTTFGSDQHGLVWGYLFREEQPPRPVDCDTAVRLLREARAPGRPGEFLWLHFSLSNAAAERWLRQNLALPEAFHTALHEGVGATRLEQDGDALIVVLHDVLFEFRYDASEVSTVCLCVQPRVMISARARPLRSLDRLRATVKAGETFGSPVALLADLLRNQAEGMVDIVRQSTARVDGIEDQLLRHRVSVSRSELAGLRRMLVRLQRLLTPEPAALFRLLSRPPAWMIEADVQMLRQAAEEFATAVADSGALVERIRLIQEELAAILNEHSNRTLFLLTLATVVALPFNVIAGIFGMNVGGIPLAGHHHGFAIVIAAVTILTALAGIVLLRRRQEW